MLDIRVVRVPVVTCILMSVGGWAGTSGEITRYPYLQPTNPSDTTIGIAWRTAQPSDGTIEYGINKPDENTLREEEPATKHYLVLKGLRPGVVYKYRVISDGTTTPVYHFRTSPPDGRFKALLLSDTHAQSATDPKYQQWLERWTKYEVSHMLEYAPDLVLICGDITQTGRADQYDELFLRTRDLFASAIVLPIQGNHDKGDDIFRDQWYLPQEGPEGLAEVDYSYDYGGSHFLMLWQINEAVAAWADKDLAKAAGSRFHFGMWHYPVYMDTRHDYKNQMDVRKRQLIDLFDRHGMDVWFQGHRHTAQRTLPIVKNPVDPASWGLIYTPEPAAYNGSTRGTIYMQIRSSWYGWVAGQGLNPYMASEDRSDGEYIGHCTLDVNGSACRVRSLRCAHDGTGWGVEDEFTIDKADTKPAALPRFASGPVAAVMGGYRAEIRCQTAVAARVVVDYGTEAGRYAFSTPSQDVAQTFGTRHSIWLQGLQPRTKYFYRVRASVAGKQVQSNEEHFNTQAGEMGQVVAKFDFQPKQYVPPADFCPAADAIYSPAARCGWVGSQPVADREIQPAYGSETGTFCAADNAKPSARWQADLPDGTYDVQIGQVNVEKVTGQTRIALQAGNVVITAPPEPEKDLYCTWTRRLTVSDGKLDLELGCNDKTSSKSSVISWLTVRDARGMPVPSTEPSREVSSQPAATQPAKE